MVFKTLESKTSVDLSVGMSGQAMVALPSGEKLKHRLCGNLISCEISQGGSFKQRVVEIALFFTQTVQNICRDQPINYSHLIKNEKKSPLMIKMQYNDLNISFITIL